MDTKITLSFNKQVIEAGKKYAKEQGISLSRLTEILLRKLTSQGYNSIEDFPVANWVNMVSEGEAKYISKPRSKKDLKSAYRERKK